MELTKEFFEEQLKTLATKDDLKGLAKATDLETVKDEIKTINTRLDDMSSNMATMDAKLNTIETEVKIISDRDIDDSSALASDVVKLTTQVKSLQRRVKKLEAVPQQ